jgi:hypothetical protein
LLPPPTLGKELGKDCLKKLQNTQKCLQTAFSASGRFSSVVSKRCEEFRRGQKKQQLDFV